MIKNRRSLPALALAGLLAAGVAACGDDGTDVMSLEVGDCFNDDGLSSEVESVPVVDCTEAHDNEIYAIHDLSGDELPDDAALEGTFEDECIGGFEEFVGAPYESSEIYATAMYPTEESWGAGDRELVCYVYDGAGQVEESLEGANR
jgi:hypothetical protein